MWTQWSPKQCCGYPHHGVTSLHHPVEVVYARLGLMGLEGTSKLDEYVALLLFCFLPFSLYLHSYEKFPNDQLTEEENIEDLKMITHDMQEPPQSGPVWH